jgi:hypothetical protein
MRRFGRGLLRPGARSRALMNAKYNHMPDFSIFMGQFPTYFISDWLVECPSGMPMMMPIRLRNDQLEAT